LRRCARTNRRPQLSFERLSQQSTVGNGERQRRPGAVTPLRIERAPEQQIALPAFVARNGATTIPAERWRHRLNLPRSLARGKTLVRTKHAIEKSRRIRTHQLPPQAVGRRQR